LVEQITVNGEKIFTCSICGFGYRNHEIAEKCEKWCNETGSCNIAITDKAVYYPSEDKSNLPARR
jgi:hypothetical protein